MPNPTQTNRLMALGTPLGEDVLLVERFEAFEHLSRPFRFELKLLSADANIAFGSILGERVTLRLERQDTSSGPEYFNGFVSRFRQVESAGDFARYEMTVVPWLWFLTRTSDCRIFQEMTVPDIIKKACNDAGFSDIDISGLTGTYRTWEYCVQYRETAFNFLSRLMEQEGICYYFKHEEQKHTLMLADAPSAHAEAPGLSELVFRPEDRASTLRERVSSWTIEQSVQAGSYVLTDYDFKQPKKLLLTKSAEPKQHAAADFEMYDFPGEYVEPGDGDKYAQIRLQELHTDQTRASGETDAKGIRVGYIFELTEHPREDQNRKHLVVSTSRSAETTQYRSGESGASDSYSCSFVAIDAKHQFRPARVTPKPIVSGCQTAFVVGKPGEEIDPDEFGRVKVKFHWDRDAKGDHTSSCWMRVSQTVAGKRWGAIHIPRIGQEVIVEFLEGDPDRPIITGRVYNGINKPPYDLPGMKTVSGMKSNSSKGGQGFNEIRFEDKKGDEQIFLHAEKNIDIRAKNDRFESIGHDRNLDVGNDKFEEVKNDRHETIGRDHMERIKRDRHLTVDGKEAKKVVKTLSLTVEDDVSEVFKKNASTEVTKNLYIKGDNICIEGMTNITLKVGGSAIAIEADGIRLETTGNIELDAKQNISSVATMNITSEATMNWEAVGKLGFKLESPLNGEIKGLMTNVKGTGMLVLKGGLVMIN